MTARHFIVLGILLMGQSAFAITDGIYRAEQSNVVLEVEAFTKVHEAEPKQYITVRQVKPVVKKASLVYMLVQRGLELNRFEFGDLRSLAGVVPGRVDFVVYNEPVSMKQLLVLTKSDGEEIVFQFLTNASQF